MLWRINRREPHGIPGKGICYDLSLNMRYKNMELQAGVQRRMVYSQERFKETLKPEL